MTGDGEIDGLDDLETPMPGHGGIRLAARDSAPKPGVLRNPDFRRLWIAETISQFGTQVSLLAVPLVAVVLLEATPFEVALLGTIEFLPFILFSLPAGAWVDRLRRRPILIIGDVGRALSLASIPIAFAAGRPDDLAALRRRLRDRDADGLLRCRLPVVPAVASSSATSSWRATPSWRSPRTLAQTAGPALGGGLIGILTRPVAILVDCRQLRWSRRSSSSSSGARSRPRTATSTSTARPARGMRQEVADGLRYVLGQPYLRGIAAAPATSNLFSNIAFATFIVYAVRELGLSPAEIGIVFGIGNLGALARRVTAIVWSRRFGRRPDDRGFDGAHRRPRILLVALRSAPQVADPVPRRRGLADRLLDVVYNINQVSFRQAITPPTMQGRMNATMRFIVWGTIPVGSILGGIIATASACTRDLGRRDRLSSSPCPLLISPVHTLMTMPEPVAGTAGMADAGAGGRRTEHRRADRRDR